MEPLEDGKEIWQEYADSLFRKTAQIKSEPLHFTQSCCILSI